jgi:hypothetical protein
MTPIYSVLFGKYLVNTTQSLRIEVKKGITRSVNPIKPIRMMMNWMVLKDGNSLGGPYTLYP